MILLKTGLRSICAVIDKMITISLHHTQVETFYGIKLPKIPIHYLYVVSLVVELEEERVLPGF